MSKRKPWFLLMTPEDANRPDAMWIRQGAVSRVKVTAMPIALEGWLVTLGFVALLTGAMLLIWLRGAESGALSTTGAVIATILVGTVLIGGFAWIVRTRSVRLPPAQR